MHWKKWIDLIRPKAAGGMDFRDIQKFNLAMLGKQELRIMSNPSSLCARVLKGRYFPNGDFLSARKKKNSSHSWCAILAGRAVLERGLICQNGDGLTTDIWNEKWILDTIDMKLICRPDGALATRVCELLTPLGSWDDRKLCDNFLPMDTEAIRRIPLARIDGDLWAWTGEKHMLYSVRSAYRIMAVDDHHREDYIQGTTACSGDNNSWMWKKLWESKVLPKVRVLWWQVANKFIPSRANLHRRHIEPLSTYTSCGAEPETTFQALTKCSYAQEFLRLLQDLKVGQAPRPSSNNFDD
jgi:hypothetical protein